MYLKFYLKGEAIGLFYVIAITIKIHSLTKTFKKTY